MAADLKGGLPPGLLAILLFIPLAAALLADDQERAPQSNQQQNPAAAAEDASDDPAPAERKPIQVPKGSPKELLAFIEQLQQTRPQGQTREELVMQVRQTHRAIVAASERILRHKNVDDETETKAFTAQLQSLSLLARLDDAGARQELLQLAADLKDHDNDELARMARQQWLLAQSQAVLAGDAKAAGKLADEMEAYLAAGTLQADDLRLAQLVARSLEMAGEYDAALKVYDQMAQAFDDHAELKQEAQGVAQAARERLGLIGEKIEITGTTLQGKPLDWESYRGKVVLVDFWATWCGPCVEELPNVKANYEKYHDQGFEVVGVSLDEDRQALERFVKTHEIPWANLFSESAEQTGELADRFGIRAIPATLLVDRQGKLVTFQARGEALGKQLEKLLGPAKKTAREEPAKTER